MKRFLMIYCLILCGCITEFEPKGMEEIEGILVVEGFITDDESVITLSRSKGLSFEDNIFDLSPYHVTGAKVYIECNDGMQWGATSQNDGQYTIVTGKLNPERQYRLKIELEAHEYQSEFASPMVTPEIDSVFWTKRESGQPVNIHVATHAPDNMVQYYRWSYREEWEIRPRYQTEDLHKGKCPECGTYLDRRDVVCPNCGFELRRFPYYCWKTAVSREMLLGSTEKTVLGQVAEKLTEITPTDIKLEILYRIDVRQHAIRKRAYDYFTNVKKNAQETGSLFAHIPAELQGNITCTTDPARSAIGYMDVASSAQKRLYISYLDDAYERDISYCQPFSYQSLSLQSGGYDKIPWAEWVGVPDGYVQKHCVDCTYEGATKYKPADWPDTY